MAFTPDPTALAQAERERDALRAQVAALREAGDALAAEYVSLVRACMAGTADSSDLRPLDAWRKATAPPVPADADEGRTP